VADRELLRILNFYIKSTTSFFDPTSPRIRHILLESFYRVLIVILIAVTLP